MAGTTISSKTTAPLKMTTASQSPLLVTGAGAIDSVGSYGVEIVRDVTASVTNLGTIAADLGSATAGIEVLGTAAIVNGGTAGTSASISGYRYGVEIGSAGAASITNFGTLAAASTVFSAGVFAVNLNHQVTTIVNGSLASHAARIDGYTAGIAEYGAGLDLTNFGTIAATQGFTPSFNGAGTGVIGWGVSTLVNGAAGDTAASISGYFAGVILQGAQSKITNFGTVTARDSYTFENWTPTSQAVVLHDGGSIVNGSTADAAATLKGAGMGASVAQRAGYVTNFGTISGTDIYYGEGLALAAGGRITNGSAADGAALIEGVGSFGIDLAGARPSVVDNFGTIQSRRGDAIRLQGGAVANAAKAVIEGVGGIYALGAAAVSNFGTVSGRTTFGVDLLAGGTVRNAAGAGIAGGRAGVGIAVYSGTASISNAGSITGFTGILFERGAALSAGGTVVNAGTIGNAAGTAGIAIRFGAGAERLVDVPGSVIVGRVLGGVGSNVLQLAAGASAGTIGGVGSSFVNFETIAVDPGARWTITGKDSIGTLTGDGTLTVAGSLDVTARVEQENGTLAFGATATLEVAIVLGSGPKMQFLTGDLLVVDNAAQFGADVGLAGYAGPLLEDFAASDSIDLHSIDPSGVVLSYATASGVLTIGKTGGALASLLFQTSSLGTGSFHVATDGAGGTLLSHS